MPIYFSNFRLQLKVVANIFSVLLMVCFAASSNAQVFVEYNAAVFNTPGNMAFLESYLLFDGAGLTAKVDKGMLYNSVHVEVKITHDTSIIKAAKYNIQGPSYLRGEKIPLFIDQQRYALQSGHYGIELNITDNFAIQKKNITIKDSVHVNFPANKLSFSNIEAIESYSRATVNGALTKSGIDMVPFFGTTYGSGVKQMSFYCELYGADKVLAPQSTFIMKYYLETASLIPLSNFGGFKKQSAAAVNPLLAKLDISNLGPGKYNLVIEVVDAQNKILHTTRSGFVRENKMMEVSTLVNQSFKEEEAAYFGRITDADTLKMLVESLWPIANNFQKDQIINQSVKKDVDLMKKYLIDFWQKRSGDTTDPVKLWAAYYREVQKTMANFKCGKQPGYYTDRGRVFLQYGAPSVRTIENTDENTFPYEIWLYYRTTDQSNGQFFSNRRFVFVNKQLGDDCFKLIHSDMRGEPNNPRWQFEVSRRNNNGTYNPDNTTPNGTQFNRMNELYNSPR